MSWIDAGGGRINLETTFTRRSLSAAAVAASGLNLLGPRSTNAHQGTFSSLREDGSAPVEAAISQSRLEVTNNIFALYRQMHSDSRAEVPLYAVQYWYDTAFLPLGPKVLQFVDIRFLDWTWEVTGQTYPNTAEVSYTQAFTDGPVVEDKVRLVQEDGQWRWFFGRSRAFIDEQIDLASAAVFPDESVPAEGWIAAVIDFDIEALDRLPLDFPGDGGATLTMGAGDGGENGRRYVVPREYYVLGAVDYQRLSANQRAVDLVRDRLDQAAQGPAFEVLAWDLSRDAEVVYATFTAFANEAVGNAVFTVVASDETKALWTVTALTADVVDALGMALVGPRT